MRTSTEILKDISKAHSFERMLEDELQEVRANKSFKCLCGKRHKIKDCDAIQFYHRSYSSYEDGTYGDIHIACPKTGILNRVYMPIESEIPYEKRNEYGNNLNTQFERIYKSLFKSHKYGSEDKGAPWENNNYFRENYKKFDLRIAYYEQLKEKAKRLK